MTAEAFVAQWLALNERPRQLAWLQDHIHAWQGGFAPACKAEADRLLRADVQNSLAVARLLQEAGKLLAHPTTEALGLLAEANARSIGLGEYTYALKLYQQASLIYRAHSLPIEDARAQVGAVAALSFLGRYQEAETLGEWASQVLAEYEQTQPLAALTMNLAIMYARKGDDPRALARFDQAATLYNQLGDAGRAGWLWVQLNRAFVLRNLGQFAESQAACRIAQAELEALGQPIAAARAQQNLALTDFILGRYNEALAGLDRVREVFAADGRQRDALLVDLFTGNCLLHLRRYQDVIESAGQVRRAFVGLGAYDVAAKAIVNEGVAYAGLGDCVAALASLQEAKTIFRQIDNRAWVALCDLETAAVQRICGAAAEGLTLAATCSREFESLQLPVEQAQACLVAARSALQLERFADAGHWAAQALAIGQRVDVATVIFKAHHVLGQVAQQQGDPPNARTAFDAAIEQLERLRGRLMVEFRAGFLEDKTTAYEDMVLLCVALDETAAALDYVERAKSRVLVDMLAYRLNVGIEARDPADEATVAELLTLRDRRDHLVRRWHGKEELKVRGPHLHTVDGWEQIEPEVLEIEGRLTRLWHKLLVRNADYARDAALWRVQTEPVQPYLDDDSALVEYYFARGQLLAFVATRTSLVVRRLPVEVAALQRVQQLLNLNMQASSRSGEMQAGRFVKNAQALLGQLHQQLIAPLLADLDGYRRWIIVPCGTLHYLPFQALWDGSAYLVEQRELSYLPGASLLRFCDQPRQAPQGLACFGHSLDAQLPHTLHEAQAIHAIFGGELRLEQQATRAAFTAMAGNHRVLHLATHGSFRADNPLFSGLALADGWLTTLDCFNLHLNASLITLSACQTGRSALGGGDELLGLMRGLLYAGAASLVLTLWTVEDRCTADLMRLFYQALADGHSKAAALRHAQLAVLDDAGGHHVHPYFWAPFFLVGHAGQL
ncbi:MAG: CHAT domain-containing tetratricopeptide repeat protein [Caldilineales bacterium]